jgi:hypothetical protein
MTLPLHFLGAGVLEKQQMHAHLRRILLNFDIVREK